MSIPLSEELRPNSLDEIIGQEELLGEKGFIRAIIQSKKPLSLLLWGPPGSGKTSIARLYAKSFNMRFETMSAIFSGIQEIKRIVKELEETPLFGRSILLFVDELHRFNKAQQDAFLPFLESGQIILVGATVENPSFYLNSALLSRMRVVQLKPLCEKSLETILRRYEEKRGPLTLSLEERETLIHHAQGDGRYLLNLLENLVASPTHYLQKRAPLFDKGGDQHYNLISALHKSVRGSDPDASLYWLCRMLQAGEDPLFIARRVIRMASEDVGLADPQALTIAIAAKEAYELMGSPEGELAIAEAVVYMALAPKSNALYKAYNEAKEVAEKSSHLPPPLKIVNAPTQLMKKLGYGKGYIYDHDALHAFSGQNYFPDDMDRCSFYSPEERGFEREMKKRLRFFTEERQKREL